MSIASSVFLFRLDERSGILVLRVVIEQIEWKRRKIRVDREFVLSRWSLLETRSDGEVGFLAE